MMDRTCFLVLYFVTLLLIPSYMSILCSAAIPTIDTDKAALLALKAKISSDPHNFLTSNWSTGTSVCSWVGVICGSKHHRVRALDLSYMGIVGTISPHLGNISFLISLRIPNNSFHGSIPDELGRLRRLRLLNVGFNNFGGEISPWIGLLSKLQYLFLYGNSLTGTVPSSISNLSSLRIISLSFNLLSGSIPSSIFNISTLQEINLEKNKLSGPLPSSILNMSSLKVLDLKSNNLSGELPLGMFDHLPILQRLQLSYNRFYGKLPATLFKCNQLQSILLWDNEFMGRLPPEIGNLTKLTKLRLAYNNFAGAIPSEIGNLQSLEEFNIGANSFSGSIPFEIFNISSIQVIGMALNSLSGHLPSNVGIFLPNLRWLLLGGNELSGTIPSSISNASQLAKLDLANNSLSGFIPEIIGNLRLLQLLNLEFNNLTLESPDMRRLFSSLSNCPSLEILSLSNNPLNGVLPSSFGNLSTSFQKIFLGDCNIKGNLLKDVGNLSNLILLDLGANELIGHIPTSVERLRNLVGLYLDDNRLEGPIPSSLCHLKRLFEVYLGGNELVGYIPECIGNLSSLRGLYLEANQLTSMIPLSLWSLADLLDVSMSSNSLNGSVSLKIGNLKALTMLDLSGNQLFHDIPKEIGGLKDLVHLSLAGNQLEGSIPGSFGELISLESLDLSSNYLSGEIPKSMEKLLYLKYLNVSFNRLQGRIPTEGPFVNFSAASFISNDDLCGAPQLQVPPCKEGVHRSKKATAVHVLKYLLPAIGLTTLIVSVLLVLKKWQKKKAKIEGVVDLSPLVTRRRISYQELSRATEGFSGNNLLGEGSFGSVYKGTLLDGMNVAVKVLNLQVEGAFRSFEVECEVLRNIHHRNLVKIISTCSNDIDFKAFVMEYMPNGDLEKWLYADNYFLDMLQRVNIMIDVANALEYLHFGYSTPIVHCDLKPSNILVDEDMVAHVADFGIAKFLGVGDSLMRTITLATIGYMAPEYGSEGIVSIRGDVYSFGILLMEIFTRKKPTEDMFAGEMSLKRWVEESLSLSLIKDVVDTNLLRNGGDFAAIEDCLSSIMGLALSCCEDSPERRSNMKDAAAILKKIKLRLVRDTRR